MGALAMVNLQSGNENGEETFGELFCKPVIIPLKTYHVTAYSSSAASGHAKAESALVQDGFSKKCCPRV
jgi:hypothetical protein